MYASVEDVKARWIASSLPPDDDVIAAYIADAAILIDADSKIQPPVADRIDSEPGLADRARIVCVRAALRCLYNPDQVRSVAGTNGPFTDTTTYAAESLQGSVSLTDEDRALLTPRAARVASVMPYREGGAGEGENVLFWRQIINGGA